MKAKNLGRSQKMISERENEMARRQRPDYTSLPPSVLLGTRTNWQDVKHPVDQNKSDTVYTLHKRTVYVEEKRKEWWDEYKRHDDNMRLLQQLDSLSDMLLDCEL